MISDGSDGATLLLWLLLKTFLGETSVLNCFACNISTKQSISRLAYLNFRFDVIQFIIFSEVLIEHSHGQRDINSFGLSFFGLTVPNVVEVN